MKNGFKAFAVGAVLLSAVTVGGIANAADGSICSLPTTDWTIWFWKGLFCNYQ